MVFPARSSVTVTVASAIGRTSTRLVDAESTMRIAAGPPGTNLRARALALLSHELLRARMVGAERSQRQAQASLLQDETRPRFDSSNELFVCRRRARRRQLEIPEARAAVETARRDVMTVR